MESAWPWVLKIMRQETDVTQLELARIIGVDCGSVSRWERGLGKPGHIAKIFIGEYYLENKNNIREGYRKQFEVFFRKEKVKDFWVITPLFP